LELFRLESPLDKDLRSLGELLLAVVGGLAERDEIDPLELLTADHHPIGRDGKFRDRVTVLRLAEIRNVFTQPPERENFAVAHYSITLARDLPKENILESAFLLRCSDEEGNNYCHFGGYNGRRGSGEPHETGSIRATHAFRSDSA